ncbi:MAG TPA: hypothetical protein VI893_03440 [Thermoplasmata archaeon]|nr:hypothetical protein [Thermoplasmata archaeon]
MPGPQLSGAVMTSSAETSAESRLPKSIVCVKCGFPTRMSTEIPCWTCWWMDTQRKMLGIVLGSVPGRGRWKRSDWTGRLGRRSAVKRRATATARPARRPEEEKA